LIVGTFHGTPGSDHSRHADAGRGLVHGVPLVVLIVLSTLVGAWIHPPLDEVLPASPGAAQEVGRHALEIAAMLVAVGGVAVALWLFVWRRELVARLVALPEGARVWRLWHHAWGFDALYDVVLVKPFRGLVWLWRGDWINRLCNLVPWLARGLRWLLTRSQTGRLRHYAVSMTLGATVVLIFLALG
jgi:NADH-quinone oxidoreductase subunit L